MLFTIVLIIILSIMIYIKSISENLSSVGKITRHLRATCENNRAT